MVSGKPLSMLVSRVWCPRLPDHQPSENEDVTSGHWPLSCKFLSSLQDFQAEKSSLFFSIIGEGSRFRSSTAFALDVFWCQGACKSGIGAWPFGMVMQLCGWREIRFYLHIILKLLILLIAFIFSVGDVKTLCDLTCSPSVTFLLGAAVVTHSAITVRFFNCILSAASQLWEAPIYLHCVTPYQHQHQC